jgi:TolB protein
MRKLLCALLLLAMGTSGVAWGASRVIFEREGNIRLSDMGGANPVLLGKGYDAEISPDGRSVAFTDYRQGRKIAVMDVATKKVRVLSAVPGYNSYGPRWSPDGTRLVFNHWIEEKSQWVPGVIDTTGKNLKIFRMDNEGGVHSPFWAHDGMSVYAQDLSTLYRFDTNGKLLESRPLDPIVGKAGISSATRFCVSADGSAWIFDGDVDEPDNPISKAWGEPIAGVFLHTPADGRTIRISPKGMSASAPSWAPDGKSVLFCGVRPEDVRKKGKNVTFASHIFVMPLNGTPELLVRDASNPSVATNRE